MTLENSQVVIRERIPKERRERDTLVLVSLLFLLETSDHGFIVKKLILTQPLAFNNYTKAGIGVSKKSNAFFYLISVKNEFYKVNQSN